MSSWGALGLGLGAATAGLLTWGIVGGAVCFFIGTAIGAWFVTKYRYFR